MNFLITGGCGYIGSELTKYLLAKNHKVLILDTCWFSTYYPKNKNVKFIKGDIRNFDKLKIKNTDVIIHLANVANDPAVELNPVLSWEINVLASKIVANHAIKNKVKKIIFFSSGSVYGVKKENKVTEELQLEPISVYNKTKMIAERVFLSFRDKIEIICLRPATVCGVSKRLRLDLTVNKLTYDGFYNKKILVDGGNQIRPNIHIKDLIHAVDFFASKKNKAKHNIYNVGFENLKIIEIAKKIREKTNAKIIINKNIDIRSYKQDSSRLISAGFRPQFNIEDAIEELIDFFSSKSKKFFGTKNFNLKRMKELNVK